MGYESQWGVLRGMKGWENVALSAGQVWDLRIRERVRAEWLGEEGDDDGDWAVWKGAAKERKRGKPPTAKLNLRLTFYSNCSEETLSARYRHLGWTRHRSKQSSPSPTTTVLNRTRRTTMARHESRTTSSNHPKNAARKPP